LSRFLQANAARRALIVEQVSSKTDANGISIGDLDRSDRLRTHLSDALGYLTVWDFPMRAKIGYRPEWLGM
jgi:hypothetical protein